MLTKVLLLISIVSCAQLEGMMTSKKNPKAPQAWRSLEESYATFLLSGGANAESFKKTVTIMSKEISANNACYDSEGFKLKHNDTCEVITHNLASIDSFIQQMKNISAIKTKIVSCNKKISASYNVSDSDKEACRNEALNYDKLVPDIEARFSHVYNISEFKKGKAKKAYSDFVEFDAYSSVATSRNEGEEKAYDENGVNISKPECVALSKEMAQAQKEAQGNYDEVLDTNPDAAGLQKMRYNRDKNQLKLLKLMKKKEKFGC